MGKKLALPLKVLHLQKEHAKLLLIEYLIYYTRTHTHTHTQVGKKLALTLKVLQLQKEHADKVEQVLLIEP